MNDNIRPENMERITTPELAMNFIEEQVEKIRNQVGDKKVLLALSGGVDSSVVAALLIKAIGRNLVCVHVNHGLMRKGESEQVIEIFGKELDANLIYVDATDRFLNLLKDVSDPEKKRKIIGGEFIKVFDEESSKLEGILFLAQGTIYPDIIESKGVKAHHNVGGLPEDMQFELVEPVKLLYKDEVRVVGETLGLPHNMVYRQPFPGPGLGVRCLGAITRDRLEALREADAILREEFEKNGLAEKVWQYFIAVPDFKSVGVRNGKRYVGWTAVIRAVNTTDAMTATIEEIKRIYEFYPVEGVTTNPSILARYGRAPYEILKEIREFIGKEDELHVQAVSKTAEGIVEEAYRIKKELGENTFIKIPSIPEGFKAMKQLYKEGIKTTATVIYTPLQAYLAAKAGASYVAPYVNRIDDMGYDGVLITKAIHEMFKNNNTETKVLAASFKNSQQVLELCKCGIGASTVAPNVIDDFVKNQAIDAAVDMFIKDFESITRRGANMSNL